MQTSLCKNGLSVTEGLVEDSVLEYNDDALKSKEDLGPALTLMNYNPVEACPVIKCTLKSVGCINDYTGNKVTIS